MTEKEELYMYSREQRKKIDSRELEREVRTGHIKKNYRYCMQIKRKKNQILHVNKEKDEL